MASHDALRQAKAALSQPVAPPPSDEHTQLHAAISKVKACTSKLDKASAHKARIQAQLDSASEAVDEAAHGRHDLNHALVAYSHRLYGPPW